MKSIDQFSAEAELSVTDFRSERKLTRSLRTHHRVRVRRRNDLLGVFLDLEEWSRLVRYVAHLEAEAERREDDAVRAIIADREPGAKFEPGSRRRIAEIEREHVRT
ncbi:MAG: hypothetical protein ACREM2_09085 [Vulcanimicrobiaceae bacterium]